jgi:hypothetical protein
MKLNFVYKAVCRTNGKVHYGIHATEDPFYGTPHATDHFVSNNAELLKDIKQYGRDAITVESLQAFPSMDDATKLLKHYAPHRTYKHGNTEAQLGNKNALGTALSDVTKQKMSDAVKGEKNPFYDKQHSSQTLAELSVFRAQMKWINDGTAEKQIIKGDTIPKGWTLGRVKSKRSAKKTQPVNDE